MLKISGMGEEKIEAITNFCFFPAFLVFSYGKTRHVHGLNKNTHLFPVVYIHALDAEKIWSR
jgi:hypothetical protein